MSTEPIEQSDAHSQGGEYVVVARRYRPQSFQDLVGQGQVAQALSNAINTNRVGHAYLFTGARGVGKTSTARILAKCLNCVEGPTPTPCNHCDVCQGVSSGDDVDVLEIDGASNRGIDEIRQLRSNVNVRPSRARFKIYIIDEVHMLTVAAFNALLKTLEEPPLHVKFIFCTTDPEKIPITVLSRCQRFDFPPCETESIVDRLKFIVQSEGVEADDEVLHMLARKAAGSMRDSQSVLEQLLSYCGKKITVDDVHRLLGTAKGGSLTQLVSHLIQRDASAALVAVEGAAHEGVDVGQLAEQMLGYFRDMMAATVGCPAEMMMQSMPADFPILVESGKQLGLETILAIMQILDQAITRMRQSPHVRMLLEVAVVRICKLENLDELARVISAVQAGVPLSSASPARPRPAAEASPRTAPASGQNPAAPPTASEAPSHPQKKNDLSLETAPSSPPVATAGKQITPENARQIWDETLAGLGDMTGDMARFYDRVAINGPNRLVVSFKAGYNLQKQSCERPERRQKIEQILSGIVGTPTTVEFNLLPAEAKAAAIPKPAVVNRRQMIQEVERQPFVQQAKQIFDAEIVDVIESRRE